MDNYRRLYATRTWRRVSRLVIAAAGGVCQVTEGCPRPATTCDHFPVSAWELAQLGQLDRFFDLGNLRAACRVCNSRRGAIERNARYRGVRRGRRVRVVSLEEAAAVENAWWAQVEAERVTAELEELSRQPLSAAETSRSTPTPRIY